MSYKVILRIGFGFLSLGIILGLTIAWLTRAALDGVAMEDWEAARHAKQMARQLTPFSIGTGATGLLLVLFGYLRKKASVRNY